MGRKHRKKHGRNHQNHRHSHKNRKQQERTKKEDIVIVDDSEIHPLESPWSFWYLGSQQNRQWDASSWGDQLEVVGTVDTVEDFWAYHRGIKRPSDLDVNWNCHLFRGIITPQWEDDANIGGGRWVFFIRTDRKNLDTYWENMLLALVGEVLPHTELICGAVLNRRRNLDKISVWTRRMEDEQVEEMGAALDAILKDEAEYATSFKGEYSLHPEL